MTLRIDQTFAALSAANAFAFVAYFESKNMRKKTVTIELAH